MTIENPKSKIQNPKSDVPLWLWSSVRFGFVALVLGIVVLVIALANGVADPKPVGSLRWEETWVDESRQWQAFGSGVAIGNGRLEVAPGPGEMGGAVTRGEGPDFSFEVAGRQNAGEVGAGYGIVFAYQNEESFSAVLINGNGYVEVFSAGGRAWLPLQQWPNILLGYEANRIRIDVDGGEGLIRINDEELLRLSVGAGEVGLLARGSAESQRVRFGWAKYWSK